MASLPLGNTPSCSLACERRPISLLGVSALPLMQLKVRAFHGLVRGRVVTHSLYRNEASLLRGEGSNSINHIIPKKAILTIPRCSSSSDSNGSEDDSSDQAKKKPFGYSRKDVLLIGVGVTAIGIGLKSGLEFAGVDPLQAGNVVQLVLVLGLTIGWISTYIFRVSNKEMTYAQQIRDYESKVMEKRLEGLTEAELEALLEQVEEEKRRLGEQQVK
ncbi:hypothetical protein TB2_039424 [Malus domestica]|uniref:uncharacterized protein isoform X1 n=1 Tax=Malus domestica TaxID=3750 RepID=UPI000498E56A|nr:uncharacterized protein LOC103438095 isoform X1 [Malus domestica]XP_017188148.1 uncharacterized protein LOC103438095 isoform X1 [Malus domestica]XP_050152922.1 uncharacterized protein LOC126627434 isoform X1 [Malus sylvestris]XP_050152923.1 uncharacterized protein LOC126627434 isoform X1 [Malus sylvestris]